MSIWFFAPCTSFYFVPTATLSVVNSPQPAAESGVNKNEGLDGGKHKDLERAGYNHKRSSWTEEEDKKLLELSKSENLNWNQIGKKMQNRNSKMCYSRYRRLCYETKKRWTSKEETTILDSIENMGFNWKMIAKLVPGRTARQIEQHYHFCLRPDINKSEWTLEQDLLLVELLGIHGTNWRKLEQELKGRSENQIKNRYFGRLLKISAQKQKPEGDEDHDKNNQV